MDSDEGALAEVLIMAFRGLRLRQPSAFDRSRYLEHNRIKSSSSEFFRQFWTSPPQFLYIFTSSKDNSDTYKTRCLEKSNGVL